jgi:hypothetical protein
MVAGVSSSPIQLLEQAILDGKAGESGKLMKAVSW